MLTRFINVFQISQWSGFRVSHTLPWFDPLSELTSTAWFCEYERTKIPPVGFCWMTHQSGRRVWYWVQKQNNMPSQQLLDLLWLSDRERTICRVNNCTACLESRAGSADLFHAAALLTLYGSDITGKTQKMANAQWLWGIVTVFYQRKRLQLQQQNEHSGVPSGVGLCVHFVPCSRRGLPRTQVILNVSQTKRLDHACDNSKWSPLLGNIW